MIKIQHQWCRDDIIDKNSVDIFLVKKQKTEELILVHIQFFFFLLVLSVLPIFPELILWYSFLFSLVSSYPQRKCGGNVLI